MHALLPLTLLAFVLPALTRPHAARRTPPPAAVARGEVTLTSEDDGRRLTLSPGDTLTVRLAARMGTGYRWEVASNDAGRLEPLGSGVERAGQGAEESGGEVQVFRFRARARGAATLRLLYRRPFGRAAPSKSFSVHVSVRRPRRAAGAGEDEPPAP